ncbi:hypothetical protein HMPREF3192_00380 [Atopobium deltae]|uniref:Uncharacterized protein n=1 Tax=Atopobium deltae TaxID=1393034 RepID=A0A133XWJ5_9ACTN|nr:hypothetical protein HMPREF3192_00380 [Atopobium deltae]
MKHCKHKRAGTEVQRMRLRRRARAPKCTKAPRTRHGARC